MEKPRPVNRNFEFWRMLVIYGAMLVVFLFYGFKLYTYQVLDGPSYQAQAEENRTTRISVPTQRGTIYDRNGFVLARNVPSYNLTITPANLPTDTGALEEIYRQLSELVGMPINQGEITEQTVRAFKPCESEFGISQVVFIADTNWPYRPVRVKCNIAEKAAMIILEKADDWPGVGIEVDPIREYPTGWLTSEIIGFLGPIPATLEDIYRDLGFVPGRDKVGYAGVESSLDTYLLGVNGTRLVEVDNAGKGLRDLESPVDPIAGYNVKLTIDTRLQMAAKNALLIEMKEWNAYLREERMTNGVVIAMNPKTGEILALVSQPTFENNRMARLIPADYYQQLALDPKKPLFNQAISGEHPPGSVFKMATAIGILNEGTFDLKRTITDPGKITILQKFSPNDAGTPRDYVCWEKAGHGIVDFYHGIAWSCDVFFYKVSGGYPGEVDEGLGIWRMGEYARALGYGSVTGIELPGEENGLMPDPDWKRIYKSENWSTGDTYIAAMGQGYVLSTPLQVLTSFATLANDGKHMKPTLVKEILDVEGKVVKPFTPTMIWDITRDPVIGVYDENFFLTGERKIVESWVIDAVKVGMRMVVQEGGTAYTQFETMTVQSAGKTGTAEYCDDIASKKDLCKPGSWPAHAWYIGYAPFDNPEIVVIAFVYGGQEGSTVAGPIVRKVMDAYFDLKAIDAASSTP
jgi:penicillin-binding protein 2